VIKLLFGSVAVAGLIAACSGRGRASEGSHDAQPAQAAQPKQAACAGHSTVFQRRSPFWAGLIALTDQLAHRPLGFINPAIYRIARGSLRHAAFRHITTGDNTFRLPPAIVPATCAVSAGLQTELMA
jgi:hypothetical protein